MLRKLLVLMAVLVLTGAATVHASGILEIRAGAGMATADADDFDDAAKAANANNGIDGDDFDTYHADIFINLPALPIGFGLRHEWLNLNTSTEGGADLDVEATNLSLLIDLRLLDTPVFYLGPIVAIGHPSAKVNYKDGTTSLDSDIDADDLSYAGGVEAGFYIGDFLIGAEAGYQNIEFKSSGTSGTSGSAKFDASGFYGKAHIGVTFF